MPPHSPRSFAALVLAAVAVLAPASAAFAQDACYPPPCSPGISDTTSQPGQAVTVTSGTSSYDPGEPVEYGVRSTYQRLGETTADASGAAVATFDMPGLPAGGHHVIFTSLRDGHQVRVRFSMSAPARGVSGARGPLPRDPLQKPDDAAACGALDDVSPGAPANGVARSDGSRADVPRHAGAGQAGVPLRPGTGQSDVVRHAGAPHDGGRFLPAAELATVPGWSLVVAAALLGLVAWLLIWRRHRTRLAGQGAETGSPGT